MKIIIIILAITSLCLGDYNQKIQDYINIVATQNKINIVTDKKIDKEFNFYINKKITPDTSIIVLKNLLNENGYVLEKSNDKFYIIKSKDQLLINKIEIYKLKYANTKNVKHQLENVLNGYFRNIKKTTTTKKKNPLTPYQENTNLRVDEETVETEEKMNFSILALDDKYISVTYKDDFVPRVALKIIKTMDVNPIKIRVSLKVYEVNTNALNEFGSQFSINSQMGGINMNPLEGNIALGVSTAPVKTNNIEISTAIHALIKTGDAIMTDEPSVTIIEGKKIKIAEGKTYPISVQSTDTTNSSTTNTVTTYENKETGLILYLHFKEFRSGIIFLTMNFKTVGVEEYDSNQKQIITTKREVNLDLMLPPGKQIDLAGLNHTTTKTIDGGIPFIQDIPLLGNLFKFNREQNEENTLVIQMTAHIVDEPTTKFKNVWEETKKPATSTPASKKTSKSTSTSTSVKKVKLSPPLPKLLTANKSLIPKIKFELGSCDLSANTIKDLESLANYLKQNKNKNIYINGYTDTSGNPYSNKQLSQMRADAVKNIIVTYGIDQHRVTSKGLGDINPIATNETREGRIKNRRIEILLN